jgi:hypothetical protein
MPLGSPLARAGSSFCGGASWHWASVTVASSRVHSSSWHLGAAVVTSDAETGAGAGLQAEASASIAIVASDLSFTTVYDDIQGRCRTRSTSPRSKPECPWYQGKSTKRLLDGYRIFPGDPYADENALIEKLLKDTWANVKTFGPTIDALAPDKQIRFVRALMIHLAMMGAGEALTRDEVKAMKGEWSMNYDLKLSHFIRDYSKDWLKRDIPFTEDDLCAQLRLLTFLNYNAQGGAAHPTDVMQRHNLYPFKQLFKHITKLAKKNRNKPGLVRALRDFRGSLKWHAEKRDSQEQALARDLIAKTDDVLSKS